MSEARIQELLENNNKLLMENRKYKALYRSTHSILVYHLLDSSIMARLRTSGGASESTEEEIRKDFLSRSEIARVFERIECLEKDAGVQTSGLVREFVAKTVELLEDAETFPLTLKMHVSDWVKKFQEALG